MYAYIYIYFCIKILYNQFISKMFNMVATLFDLNIVHFIPYSSTFILINYLCNNY